MVRINLERTKQRMPARSAMAAISTMTATEHGFQQLLNAANQVINGLAQKQHDVNLLGQLIQQEAIPAAAASISTTTVGGRDGAMGNSDGGGRPVVDHVCCFCAFSYRCDQGCVLAAILKRVYCTSAVGLRFRLSAVPVLALSLWFPEAEEQAMRWRWCMPEQPSQRSGPRRFCRGMRSTIS